MEFELLQMNGKFVAPSCVRGTSLGLRVHGLDCCFYLIGHCNTSQYDNENKSTRFKVSFRMNEARTAFTIILHIIHCHSYVLNTRRFDSWLNFHFHGFYIDSGGFRIRSILNTNFYVLATPPILYLEGSGFDLPVS
jgi:hypothetical protein